MFSSVTSWLGVTDNKKEEEKQASIEKPTENETKSEEIPETKSNDSDEKKDTSDIKEEEDDSLEKTLEDVSAKAINTAKEWGSMC